MLQIKEEYQYFAKPVATVVGDYRSSGRAVPARCRFDADLTFPDPVSLHTLKPLSKSALSIAQPRW